MGKYMKKGKITGDVAVMEVPQSTSLGVRTRARTLALQSNPELSYLQLRNRRLEKPQFQQPASQKQEKPKQQQQGICSVDPSNSKSNSRLRVGSMNSVSAAASVNCSRRNEERLIGRSGSGKASSAKAAARREGGGEVDEGGVGSGDLGVEASFGENNLDFDGIERSTRESTPCSFIRPVDAIGTPCSAVRPAYSTSANPNARNTVLRLGPTDEELEEFFASTERQQQRLFMEKYDILTVTVGLHLVFHVLEIIFIFFMGRLIIDL